MARQCIECQEVLPDTDDYFKFKDGYMSNICRQCTSLIASCGKFGITIEQYKDMYTKQEGKCAICGVHEDLCTKRFHIDHDHKTGQVRGLLCHHCNVGLGHFKDSVHTLQNAISYLTSK